MLQLTHGLINRKPCYTAGNLKGLQWSNRAYTRLTGSNQPWLRWKPFSIGVAMKEIPLGNGLASMVSDEDYDRVVSDRWSFGKPYVKRTFRSDGKFHTLYLHRVILNAPKGMMVDHVNGDKLDNRRENLRLCTSKQNAYNKGLTTSNRSGFKGIHWDAERNRWRARICIDGKEKKLGRFLTAELAHKAYCEAALKYHGEFANFGDGCIVVKNQNQGESK